MTADFSGLIPGAEGKRGPNPGAKGGPAPIGAYHRTFMTYQPWQSCLFCRREEKTQGDNFAAPEEGALRCRHTDEEVYNKLIYACLTQKAERTSVEVKTLVDGTVLVTTSWVEYGVPNEAAAPGRPPRL